MTSHCRVFPHLRARDLTAIATGSVLSLGQPDPSWGLLVLFLLPQLWCWRQVAVAWGSLGFFVASLNGVMWLDTSLPEACFGEVVMMTGQVDTLPRTEPAEWGGWRVTSELQVLDLSDDRCSGPQRLLVSQHLDTQPLDESMRYGALFSASVRLKPLTSQWNPGVLPDQGRWASRGVDAAAAVIGPVTQSGQGNWLADFRGKLLNEWALNEGQGWIVLRALLLGDSRGISSTLWSDLKQLGIVHLIVISGLHIALLAGLTAHLAKLPRRLWKMPRDRGTDVLTTLATLIVSGLYVLLIGAPLPAQRAFFMLVAVKTPHLLGWSGENRRSLLLALTAMLLWEPKIALGASFWLSAAATWILVTDNATNKGVPGLMRLQTKIVFLMAPLTLFWFGEASWLGVVSNSVMLPAVTLIIVPAGLVGALLSELAPTLSSHFLELSVWTWEALMPLFSTVLRSCEHCVMVHQPLPLAGLILALIGVFCWSSHPRPARLAYLMVILLALNTPQRQHETIVTLLDVGQGLAVVIESRGKTMVYDTGDGYSGGFSQAEKTVLPYLYTRGVDVIDVLVVSHGDRDHSGGLAFLANQIPINRHLGFGGEPCRNGERWRWGASEVLVVNGSGQSVLDANDQSCGFVFTFGGYNLLALGDISADQEREVVRYWREEVSSEVVLLPHHGSDSSSSYTLLKWVDPTWALISSGRENRFGHPHATVVDRLAQTRGAVGLNTATTGAIQVRFGENHDPRVTTQRNSGTPYWLKLP